MNDDVGAYRPGALKHIAALIAGGLSVVVVRLRAARLGFGSSIRIGRSFCLGLRLTQFPSGNWVVVGDGCHLHGVEVVMRGSGNRLVIGDGVRMMPGTSLWLDDGSKISVGSGTTIERAHLAATEGTRLVLGADCMLSTDIEIRTGDSHSILDASGSRVNLAKDVTLGNHVWVGARAIILKGVTIASGAIVSAGAVVARPVTETGVAVAGNPARVVKQGIHWIRERLTGPAHA